jgi:hypothetical protein
MVLCFDPLENNGKRSGVKDREGVIQEEQKVLKVTYLS